MMLYGSFVTFLLLTTTTTTTTFIQTTLGLSSPHQTSSKAATTTTVVNNKNNNNKNNDNAIVENAFLKNSPCNDINHPPQYNIVARHLDALLIGGGSGSGGNNDDDVVVRDVRGPVVALPHHHHHHGGGGQQSSSSMMVHVVAHALLLRQSSSSQSSSSSASFCCLTPWTVALLAETLLCSCQSSSSTSTKSSKSRTIIYVGHDSRLTATTLTAAFVAGCQRVVVTTTTTTTCDDTVMIHNIGLTPTPVLAWIAKQSSQQQDNTTTTHNDDDDVVMSVVVTASHLPANRNGLKLYGNNHHHPGGWTRQAVRQTLSTTTTADDYLPLSVPVNQTIRQQVFHDYQQHLLKTIRDNYQRSSSSSYDDDDNDNDSIETLPLQGLKIVVNAGNGAGGELLTTILSLAGATVVPLHMTPNGTFPAGYVPNPENPKMVTETCKVCARVGANVGVMLDTDADRCGLVAPTTTTTTTTTTDETTRRTTTFVPVHRNRLIALLATVLGPGARIVTDSCTSEGLATFLHNVASVEHVRHVKGYANVIARAQECNADLAVETSGHSAFAKNQYIDDGMYTVAVILGWWAGHFSSDDDDDDRPLLMDFLSDLPELSIEQELRLPVKDGSLSTMEELYDICALALQDALLVNDDGDDDDDDTNNSHCWELDTDNKEGMRIRTGQGSFFMLRKSLHDPVLSIQLEAHSWSQAESAVLEPVRRLWKSVVADRLDLSALDVKPE